jgi:hypothetical protein
MPSHSPAVLVALLSEMIMAQELGIEVIRLIGGMMNVVLGTLEEEEAVVVDKFGSTVKMEESGDIRPVLVIDDLRVACQRLRLAY